MPCRKTVDPGDERDRLVQADFWLGKQLASDVGFGHGIRVVNGNIKPRMSQCLQGPVHTGQ